MPATIVVPCYNEAPRLDVDGILEFLDEHEGYRFVFVDDGSRDATRWILSGLHEAQPDRVAVLCLGENQGKAEAVRRGVLRALEAGTDYVAFWDADMATPLEEIPRFRRRLDDDPRLVMVMGTRLPLLGHCIERQPVRRVLGRVFARAASLVLGLRVFDTQCGAKMFRAGPLVSQMFAHPFLSRWIFDVEILARLCRRAEWVAEPVERLVSELPLRAWRDVAGSRLKGRDFATAAAELTRIRWTYFRRDDDWSARLPHASAGSRVEDSWTGFEQPARRYWQAA